jgi:hypothetical protein
MRLYIFATIFAILSSGATAELQCDRQLLSEMASEIIFERQNLTGFGPAQYGGHAAYLMLRSGRMNEIQLVNAIGEGRKPRGFDSLLMAHRIATLGPRGVEQWGDDPRDILISADESVERAILLLDQGETYFDIVRQIQADPNYVETFNTRWMRGVGLYRLVIDQTEDILKQIAERAENDGYMEVAAPLYAIMPEGNYEKFWERVKDTDFERKSLISPSAMRSFGIFSLGRNRPLFSDIEQNVTIPNLYHLSLNSKALSFGPGGDILAISLHQSGLTLEMALVSSLFIAAVNTGKIDPTRRPEESWDFLLSEMTYVLGSQVAEKTLAPFVISADRRHYAGAAIDVLEIATAIEASKEWLRNETAEIPQKPLSLTEGFDWTRALAVWSVVKTGERFPVEVLTEEMLTLAIEGHIQREEFDKALDMAERTNGLKGRLIVARDIMYRQNRLCDQHGLLRNSLYQQQLLWDFP